MKKLALTLTALGLSTATAGFAVGATGDQTFATKAAQGGLAEVQMGQLAQQKAASPRVKQFGQMLVQDHTMANQQLQQIATDQNLELPTEPSQSQRSTMQRLQGMSGNEFDREFLQYQVKDHQHDIAEFRQEAQSGKDDALKSFAGKTIPVLQKHLQMAESLSRNQ